MKDLLPILSLMAALLPGTLLAQELPRPSLARHGNDNDSRSNTLPTDYNIKLGPVLLTFNSTLEAEYIDNVGLNNTGPVSDFLLTPEIGMNATWPVSEVNTLSLTTSLGYTFYLFHPEYDTSQILVSPNSALAFDVYVGDFKFDFHDNFSYQQDPVSQAVLSNIVNFDRFTNDAGVGVTWDLNKVILELNYDHINFYSFDLQNVNGSHAVNAGALDYVADQISLAAESHISSTLSGGVEGVISSRSYNQFSGDYNSLTVGPFVSVQVTDHIQAQASAGYAYTGAPANNLTASQILQPNDTTTNPGGNSDSYYFDVALEQKVNSYYFHRLDVGHDLQFDLLGNQSESTSVNYTSTWKVNDHLNLAFTLGYQNVDEVGGGLLGVASYNVFNAGVQTSFPITKDLSSAVFYQFNDKMADSSDQDYLQNRVGMILTYHF